MGGGGGDAKVLGRIPSPGVKADHRDDGEKWGGQGVVITPGGGGNGRRGSSSHWRVHHEVTGGHSRKCGLPPHL